MMDRAIHLDGDVHLFTALTIRSALDVYGGKVDAARRAAQIALDASNRTEGRELRGWLLANLGFLEVSLGNFEATVTTLRPVIDNLFADPDYSEIIVASSVSDAIEAMVALGQTDEAEKLTELVLRNGTRLDRPWMLSVATRGTSMLLAARGDIAGGVRAAEEAMAQHDRVPMPFERARTQLLLGQLRRRLRQRQAASVALQEALDTFERLNTPLWAARARADLARATTRPGAAALTPSERRVAELVSAGKTNRAIAGALFISPKTVDTNLGRIYRKLGIHSRAELARWMSDHQG
jgi:DNA-binding CsgD family transcriptional regulator